MAFEIFMKYGDVTGDVTNPSVAGWIEIDSFSFGATNPANTTPGGGASGRVSVSEITVTKSTDSSSVSFFKNCVTGVVTESALIQFYKLDSAGGLSQFLQFTLSDTLVSSYELSAAGAASAGGDVPADLPTESLSLNFVKIEMTYTAQTSTKNVEDFTFDLDAGASA